MNKKIKEIIKVSIESTIYIFLYYFLAFIYVVSLLAITLVLQDHNMPAIMISLFIVANLFTVLLFSSYYLFKKIHEKENINTS